jgi:ubiquinone/menaquinone biosynthesis C-methylase UbiE
LAFEGAVPVPMMSQVEQAFCRSLPWRWLSQRVVVPWAVQDRALDGRVLELGSGSGAMASDLLDRYERVRLTATDIDPTMVNSARDRLAGRSSRADVVRVDATALPFASARFDAVVSFLMLHHVIEWEQALHEAVRVLRPGGTLIGYDLVDSLPARVVHRVDRSPHRLATSAALRAALDPLEVEELEVDESLAGLVVRFAVAKRSPRAADAA